MGKVNRALAYADGASRGNPGPAAIGGVIIDSSGPVLKEISQAIGRATNNVAEYKALIAVLEAARDLGVTHLYIRMDSELVVKQTRREYRTRNAHLRPMMLKVQGLLKGFQDYSIDHVPRWQNTRADALCDQALKRVGN